MSLESTQWSSSYSRPRCIERDVSIATGGTDVTWQPVVCRSRLQHPLVGGELETINLLFRRAHIVETHLKDLTWYLKPVGSNLIICHHSHRIIFMQYNLFVGGSICSIAGRTWQSPPFFGGRGVLSASVVWPFFFQRRRNHHDVHSHWWLPSGQTWQKTTHDRFIYTLNHHWKRGFPSAIFDSQVDRLDSPLLMLKSNKTSICRWWNPIRTCIKPH